MMHTQPLIDKREIIARDIAKMHIHDELPLPVMRYSRAWIVSLTIPLLSFIG
jgi:hypothetical protein